MALAEIVRRAEEAADTARKKYGVEIPVMDICRLTEKIGGKVVASGGPNQVYAELQPDGDSFRIIIPDSYALDQRNFLAAHCLGHLFLHCGYPEKRDWNNVPDHSGKEDRTKEAEANAFAEAFLMPEEKFSRVYETYLRDGVQTEEAAIRPADRHFLAIRSTASYFKAERTEVIMRAVRMGYLQC